MRSKLLIAIVLFILTGQILHAATPVISSFNPSLGPIGTLVTITGTGLGNPKTFAIGGKTAIVISGTATKLVGLIMPGSVTGEPAPLTITADDETKISGKVNPALKASFAGFVNGDTKADLATQPTITTTATKTSPAGNYPIKASGAADPDYDISYVDGTLTVTVPTGTSLATADGLTDGPQVNPAVSPNGDGINDVLTINKIEQYPDNKLILVDKNGAKIFEQIAYDNVNRVFSGKSNIDWKQEPAGTYFYILQYNDNGTAKTKSGYFVIRY